MRKNKRLYAPVAILGLLLIGAPTVNADTDTSMQLNTTVQGGLLELSASSANPFGNVSLERNATAIRASFDGEFIIEDARGTQAGYRLDVMASPFELVQSEENYTLPTGSLVLEHITATTVVAGLIENAPTLNHTVRRVIDNGPVTLLTAQPGKGMGAYGFSFSPDALVLTVDPTTIYIPSGATSAHYESTLTWSLVQAP